MPSRLSSQYWRFPVSGEVDGVEIQPDVLTLDDVKVAVLPRGAGQPTDGDWHDGDWRLIDGKPWVRIKVGPVGGTWDFSANTEPTVYNVYAKVLDSHEVPVFMVGSVLID